MVETPCPGCRRPVKARDDQVGRRVKCSKCGTRFPVPADARDVLDFADAPPRRRRTRLGQKLLAALFLAGAAGGAVGLAFLVLHVKPLPEQPVAAPAEPEAPPVVAEAPHPEKARPAPAAKASPVPKLTRIPAGREFALRPPNDPPELVQAPATVLGLDVPFAAARRVFPPAHRDADPAVLWESRPAFQGVGRKLTLGLFSPQTGGRVGAVQFDADPGDPVCDLSADGTRFAAVVGRRVTAWEVKTGAKLLDGFDPYADRPRNRPPVITGLAFAGPPDRLAVVDAAGGVLVWEVASKRLVGEFTPPGPAFGPAVVGAGPGRGAVAVAARGGVFSANLRGGVAGTRLADLGDGVGRPLAVAGSAGGKVAVAFETAGPKPEQLVALLRPDGNHPAYRWPAGVGEPVSAGWCGETVAAFGTTTGAAVWFEAEGDSFRPLAVARVPGDKALHAPADDHWSLLPGPDGKAVLVGYAMPPQGLVDPLEAGPARPAVTLRLDSRGLFR
ncbi:MAG: hypothetical protein K2X82_11695 [Gemmataceae bacterium]|nr:hypothetical protein [Gemmataceae bacterium]